MLTLDIFEIIRNQTDSAGGELQLLDASNSQVKNGAVKLAFFNGCSYDCGSVRGYVWH